MNVVSLLHSLWRWRWVRTVLNASEVSFVSSVKTSNLVGTLRFQKESHSTWFHKVFRNCQMEVLVTLLSRFPTSFSQVLHWPYDSPLFHEVIFRSLALRCDETGYGMIRRAGSLHGMEFFIGFTCMVFEAGGHSILKEFRDCFYLWSIQSSSSYRSHQSRLTVICSGVPWERHSVVC
jgi:hypothetical protein